MAQKVFIICTQTGTSTDARGAYLNRTTGIDELNAALAAGGTVVSVHQMTPLPAAVGGAGNSAREGYFGALVLVSS